MINNLLSRIFSAGISGIILAWFTHLYQSNENELGREAFLTKQGLRYDRSYAHPHSFLLALVVSLLLMGILFALYELVAFVCLKILEKINPDQGMEIGGN